VRMPGMGELLIILVIVVLVFGANKLPQLGDGIGKAIKNFKRGINHDDDIDVTPSDRRVASDSSSRPVAGQGDEASKVRDADVIESKVGKG
jgi:sec-independent protein translocase protein TatA